MHICTDVSSLRTVIKAARGRGHKIACVPTMGALHAGHVSLMERGKQDGCFVETSIFVNPTQFGPNEDFSRYPRTLDDDLELCKQAGVDVVFLPDVPTMYPAGSQTTVHVSKLTELLEGRFRPGHFTGVTTVVMKLFQIMQPDIAYFGQKDYQQLRVIQQMTHDLNLPIIIEGCPTIREPDGLAMSSRNRYLSSTEREQALCLTKALKLGQELLSQGKTPKDTRREMQTMLTNLPYIQLQYATIVDPITLEEKNEIQPHLIGLIALYLGKTRLIDNQEYHMP